MNKNDGVIVTWAQNSTQRNSHRHYHHEYQKINNHNKRLYSIKQYSVIHTDINEYITREKLPCFSNMLTENL